ncbi:hypothetical protein NE237_015603 [Protea cynaroides]|uniref:Uncharacterized protein n=1 Tax=Protea cynaroides TaxID=273540 RepID=A0A9Q0KEB9_9MAGN|nr:hypothetical protein NE237_015603 [Protea cynaroides]
MEITILSSPEQSSTLRFSSKERKPLKRLPLVSQPSVDVDKEFGSVQQLSNKKKANDDVFIKLGSDKDKRKEIAKEEKAKKPLSINEFLKPAEGERYYSPGGRMEGCRGCRRGGFSGGGTSNNVMTPSIEDPGQFPTLGAKMFSWTLQDRMILWGNNGGCWFWIR